MINSEKELRIMIKKIVMEKGANMLLATVVAELFVNPEEITLEELSKRTGYSLSSVSTAINQLEKIGKIRKEKRPGQRKTYVSLEKNLTKMFLESLISAREVIIEPMKEKLPIIITKMKKEINTNDPKEKDRIKNKILWYKEYLKQLEELSKIIKHIEKEIK